MLDLNTRSISEFASVTNFESKITFWELVFVFPFSNFRLWGEPLENFQIVAWYDYFFRWIKEPLQLNVSNPKGSVWNKEIVIADVSDLAFHLCWEPFFSSAYRVFCNGKTKSRSYSKRSLTGIQLQKAVTGHSCDIEGNTKGRLWIQVYSAVCSLSVLVSASRLTQHKRFSWQKDSPPRASRLGALGRRVTLFNGFLQRLWSLSPGFLKRYKKSWLSQGNLVSRETLSPGKQRQRCAELATFRYVAEVRSRSSYGYKCPNTILARDTNICWGFSASALKNAL